MSPFRGLSASRPPVTYHIKTAPTINDKLNRERDIGVWERMRDGGWGGGLGDERRKEREMGGGWMGVRREGEEEREVTEG